jgi:hypothetical protein
MPRNAMLLFLLGVGRSLLRRLSLLGLPAVGLRVDGGLENA